MATVIESVIREELDYIFRYGFKCMRCQKFFWYSMLRDNDIKRIFVLFFDPQFICFMYSIFVFSYCLF